MKSLKRESDPEAGIEPLGEEPPALWPFGWVQRLVLFLSYDIWHSELVRPSWYRRLFYRIVRILTLASQRFVAQRGTFNAAALTYFTLLSIVPLLALATATARGLGYYDSFKESVFEPFLEEYIPEPSRASAIGAVVDELPADAVTDGAVLSQELAQAEGGDVELAQAGEDVGIAPRPIAENSLRRWIDSMVTEVDQVNSSSLGWIGLAVLIFTVIKLMATIEGSFNQIWGIRKARTLVRKLSDYLTIILITPILLLVGTGVAARVSGASGLSLFGIDLDFTAVTGALVRFAPLAAIWFAFALTYLTLPNTRTRVASALWGGLLGGTLWHITQLAYFKLQVGLAGYNAVVAGFAFVPMLLFWVYLSWVMVLMGAQVAFAHQHEHSYRGISRFRSADRALRENLALRAMIRVAVAYIAGREGWCSSALARELGAPQRALEEVIGRLADAELLVRIDDDGEARYLPGRDLSRITAKQITDSLRVGPGGIALPARAPIDQYAERLIADFDRNQSECTANKSLRTIVEELGLDGEDPSADELLELPVPRAKAESRSEPEASATAEEPSRD